MKELRLRRKEKKKNVDNMKKKWNSSVLNNWRERKKLKRSYNVKKRKEKEKRR